MNQEGSAAGWAYIQTAISNTKSSFIMSGFIVSISHSSLHACC
jgi:hypothetical protein